MRHGEKTVSENYSSINEMAVELSERRRAIAAFYRELRNYYPRKAQIIGEIARTHKYTTVNGPVSVLYLVTQWIREGAPARAGLFAVLDRLTVVYGPIVEQRRCLQIEANGLAKAIERITEAQRRRHARQQGELF